MKIPSCPICGETDLQLITDSVRFGNKADVFSCCACSFVFLDQGSFSTPEGFYEKEYHGGYLARVTPDAFDPQAYYEKMTKASKVWSDKFRGMLTGKEVVLDVGCSTGHFMDLIKEKAAAIYGYELNRKEIEFCRDVRKLDVSNRPLGERFNTGTFDYITLMFVLEHIVSPREFLSQLMSLLKPGGAIVILAPNVMDPLVSFYDIPEFKRFYFCIEHLSYFSPKTLQSLLEQSGLRGTIETIQEYPITNHLNWAYRRGPSDVLASRQGIPDVAIEDSTLLEGWKNIWGRMNELYLAYLNEHGYADRIWCVAKKN